MGLKEKVQEVRDFLKDYPNVKLIAATKYMTLEGTKELIDAGITEIGENRAICF